MGFAKLTRFALIAITFMALTSSFASAQPFQKPLRWLGEGYSAGYNRCNPGPDVDYYNPWSAHNSMLISKLPQFQNQSFQSYNMSNLGSRPIYQGVPYSVYAAPQGHFNNGYGMHGHGVQGAQSVYSQETSNSGASDSVDSSFEPYDMESDDEDDADDEDEWNDDDNEWSQDDNEDDSAKIQAPVPGKSAFSNAGFKQQIQITQPNNNQSSQLFNPFPVTGQ